MAKERKHPVMPLWVSDFLGSGACSEMTGDQQAFYLLMLVHGWNLGERGLPTDQAELRRLLRVSLRLFRSSFAIVSEQFYEQSGRFYHRRIDEEIAKLDRRRKQSRDDTSGRYIKPDHADDGTITDTVTGTITDPSPSPSHLLEKRR